MGRGRAAVATRLPVALLAAATACFAAIALDVTDDGPLAHADVRVARWNAGHEPHAVQAWAERVTHAGSAPVLAVVCVLAAAWLLHRRRLLDAATLLVSLGAVVVLAQVLKHAFHRARPHPLPGVQVPGSFSFPSGHAANAVCVFFLLALLLAPRAGRAWALGAALAASAAVGATRVLLDVHYVSDVLAGACVGLALVALALAARRLAPAAVTPEGQLPSGDRGRDRQPDARPAARGARGPARLGP